jgi:hypothetical protein
MVKDHNHGNVESPQNTSKSYPMKIQNHLCMGLVCHVQYKMKIDFIDIPTYYNIAKKATTYFMYFDFKLDIYVIVFSIGLRFVLSYFSSIFFHFFFFHFFPFSLLQQVGSPWIIERKEKKKKNLTKHGFFFSHGLTNFMPTLCCF